MCLFMGKWVGTYGRYNICVDNGCITWPRQIETIETVSLCDRPITVRNEWFEYLEQGIGIQHEGLQNHGGPRRGGYNYDCPQLFDRGTACTFNDIQGINKKIRVYADVAESATAQILLMGYDENGNWIMSEDNGVWHDGEYVSISTSPTISTRFFSSLTAVIKPITNGYVRLYEYNMDDTSQRKLAVYEPSEETPNYRRSLITAVNHGACSNPITDAQRCGRKAVTVMAKLAFIPVAVDTDFLIIGNVPALIAAGKAAIFFERDNPGDIQKGEAQLAIAKQFLQQELDSYLGDGAKISLNVETNSGMGVGPVESLI